MANSSAGGRLVGVRAAARELKLNPSTLSRYLKNHPDQNLGSASEPKVNVDALRRYRAKNNDPAPRGRHAPKRAAEISEELPTEVASLGGPNYALAKAVRETVLAQRARLDLDEKRGLLVPRREIETAIYDAGAVLQRDLLELGAQLAERLASMSESREIATLLENEHRRLLGTFAASLRSKGTVGGD